MKEDIQIRRSSKGVLAVRVKAESAVEAADLLSVYSNQNWKDPELRRFKLSRTEFEADGPGWWIARRA